MNKTPFEDFDFSSFWDNNEYVRIKLLLKILTFPVFGIITNMSENIM